MDITEHVSISGPKKEKIALDFLNGAFLQGSCRHPNIAEFIAVHLMDRQRVDVVTEHMASRLVDVISAKAMREDQIAYISSEVGCNPGCKKKTLINN